MAASSDKPLSRSTELLSTSTSMDSSFCCASICQLSLTDAMAA
jgi:hypothetical protein